MRILRLRLRHYRGITEREVALAPRGITIVSGPNEIGKSSLVEAIDLLFDELDGTTRQRVRDVQPVDRDEGAEVEAEVVSGPYHFVYAKRFQRRPRTRLSVIAPRQENHTGREAHQRVREILEETIDTELWRALRVQQGEGLTQASWLGRPALAAALDRAAGSAEAAGARERSLFEAAEAESGRYFTPTGRERRELVTAARSAAQARTNADALAGALRDLEANVQRAEALRHEEQRLREADDAAERALRAQEQAFERVRRLRELRETARAQRDAALAEEREAVQAARQRGQLVAAHAAAEHDLAFLGEELESSEPALLAARAELEHAERGLADARAALARASREEAARRLRLERERAEQALAALCERRQRIAALEQESRAERERLAALRLDADAVQELRTLEQAVLHARARVEAEGPLVQLTPRVALELRVDGRREQLLAGQPFETRVGESLLLSLPGVGDLAVVAGAGAAERLKVLEEARTRWRTRCAELGVDDHADAVATLSQRQQAEQRLAEQRRALAALRAGADDSALAALEAEQRQRLQVLGAEAGAQLALPSAPSAASVSAAPADVERVRRDCEEAEQRREALFARHHELSEQHRDTATRHELTLRQHGDVAGRLAQARAECSDDALRRRREACESRARACEARLREAETQLAACDPERAETALEAARAGREAAARALARVHDEAVEVRARLAERGEDGLFEASEHAAAEAERAETALRALRRRADAAAKLLAVLREERDASRRGYAEPLARRIEALGRGVFGDAFGVELDESLRVARRIQDGVSLRFDQLSAGAREQISLLAKLACATLVAGDGGAPVILDDALGHSDPERLARMSVALSRAAPECQILILTCSPERYQGVEEARRLRIG